MITRHGKVVLRWGDQRQIYDLKSSTKAIGVTAVGLALMDGKFGSLHEPASKYHPQLGVPPETNKGRGWLDEDHAVSSGDADRRLRQERRLHGAALRAGHEMVLQRRRAELAGRVRHAGLRPGPPGTDVRTRLLAHRHRPRRPEVAGELLPAEGDQRRDAARVRRGHQRQRRCDGPDRLSRICAAANGGTGKSSRPGLSTPCGPCPTESRGCRCSSRRTTATPRTTTACSGGTTPTAR